MKRILVYLLLAAPLLAQYGPSDRLNSTSLGLGASNQGLMLTTMWTGTRFGVFGGISHSMGNDATGTGITQGTGTPAWVQSNGSTSEMHAGMAFRLDSRLVLGLGAGFSVQQYNYLLNPGAPTYYGPIAPALGPASDTKAGPVAMANLRIGANWGLELVAGPTVAGGSVTWRF